jgi:hypothetical protein
VAAVCEAELQRLVAGLVDAGEFKDAIGGGSQQSP